MKKFMKVICMGLTAVVCIASLTACGGSSSSSNQTQTGSTSAGTTAQVSAEPYEIKLLLNMDPTQPVYMEKELLHKEFEEKLGVKFTIEFVDTQNYPQKLNLRMVSGDVPDIINFWNGSWMEDYKKYAGQGMLADLTNLINDQGTPNLSKELTQGAKGAATTKSGLYGVPYSTGPGVGARFIVSYRKDMLEAVGANVPSTLDEYYDVLQKIKTKFPDVIPIGANSNLGETRFATNSFDMIFSAFGAAPGYFYDNGGKVEAYDISPKAKDAVAYIAKLYQGGFIDKEYATMKEANMKEKVVSGKIFSNMIYWSNPRGWDKEIETFELKKANKLGKDDTIKEDMDNNPFTYLSLGQMLNGSDEKGLFIYGGDFGGIRAISAKTKDLNKVLSLFEEMSKTDMNIYANYGKEGRDYFLKDGKIDTSPQNTRDTATNLWSDGYQRALNAFSLAPNLKGVPNYFDALPLRASKPLKMALSTPGASSDFTFPLNSDTKNTKFKDLCTLRDTAWTQMIVSGDMSKWDEFVQNWKAQGGDQVLSELSAAYADQKN